MSVMFDISEWLKSALISGVKNGTLAREYTVVKTVDYVTKGVLTAVQAQEIAEAIEPAPELPSEEPEEPEEPGAAE